MADERPEQRHVERREFRPRRRDLETVVQRLKVVSAERGDALSDLSAAERARLEMLAAELSDIFRDVPAEADFFSFAISAGEPPRLWIDMTSHVVMARDRRTYQFIKDTRLGRSTLAESADLHDMADRVSDYIAERLIEREQALEADWLLKRIARPDLSVATSRALRDLSRRRAGPARAQAPGWSATLFLGGMLVGALGLAAIAWLRLP